MYTVNRWKAQNISPLKRGQGDLRLTRQSRRHRFLGDGNAPNGNSGLIEIIISLARGGRK